MPLRQLRDERALSVRELAALAGVTPATIVNIEQGHHPPRAATVRKLAAALGVPPMAIAEWAERGSTDATT